jgi:hypothetical protein
MKDYHPSPDLLKRFVCSTPPAIDPAECRRIVRHLLTGCPTCQEVTRELMQGRPGLQEIVRIVDWKP